MTTVHEPVPEDLTALWRTRWPATPPFAHRLRDAYPHRWVCFHSLPGSKRYPKDANEYAVVLDRYNTVLDELFAGMDVYVVTSTWSMNPAVPTYRPAGIHWLTVLMHDSVPQFPIYTHLFATRRPWKRGCIDALVRAVADDEQRDVFITDTAMQRIYHPYDGGADVLLDTPAERDSLRSRHPDWLSRHPLGL